MVDDVNEKQCHSCGSRDLCFVVCKRRMNITLWHTNMSDTNMSDTKMLCYHGGIQTCHVIEVELPRNISKEITLLWNIET